MEAARISFLLDKIRRTVVDQGQRTPPLDKTHTRIDRITEELEVMKAFLEGDNWSTIVAANEQPEAWIEQVKAVALKVEDIIDGYLYLVGEQRERTWKNSFSRRSNLCCDLAKAWRGIDSRLEATEKEILNLFDMRVQLGLRLSDNEDSIISKKDAHNYQVYSPMLIDEDDLVGIEENTNKLLSWLTDDDTCRQMRTIAVWGKGGQGKTTLVANVYCNDTVKRHFDCQIWVTISQSYSVEEILRRMILEIYKRKTESILNHIINSMPLSKLLTTIQENLQRKRYIIVLDDVWDENSWKQIQNAFVDSNNGSRLLITTRKHEVAKIASQGHIVELRQLNKVATTAIQQHIVELQQLDEAEKIARQHHTVELQQLDEAEKIARQHHTVELQQLDEAEKIASQHHTVELQQLDEVETIASQHHTVELQQLDEVEKIASQQYIVELQQLNDVTKIAQQLNGVTKIAQQLNEIVKIASQQHNVELQQLNEVAKIASQQHTVELQQFNEVAKIASQQHIATLQKLKEVSQQHITALKKLNEVINQQHIPALQKLNEVAKIASQQRTVELLQLIEVAKIANEQHIGALQQLNKAAKRAKVEHIIELQLNEKDAWILFCKKAFRREKNTIDCPQNLEDYARSILKKCHGSPLAISVIGGLLSTKDMKSKTEWKKVHNLFDREFGKNSLLDEGRSIINFCFNDLPYNLKDCFVYFSIFPEDYLIKKKKLIRLWVAEGFVEAKSSNRVMEEEADDYLAELVDRSMLQVVKRDEIGRPKSFRMHAVVREVTLELSRKANFCMILNGSQSVLDNSTRRLSIQTKDESLDLNRSLLRLRTLVMFSASNFSPHSLRSALISFKMLTVLELEDSPISKLPNEVSTLFSLHYLGLRWTKVKQLPNDIQKLQSLQTLDLRDSRIKKLPHGVTQLKQLRHLFVSGTEVEFGGIVAGCVPTLEGAWQWKNLQTLRSIKATEKLVQQLGDMKELRSLEVVEVKQARCPQLYTSVTKMRKLNRLCLSTRGGEQLDFEMLNSPPPPSLPLQKLDLSGRLFRGKMPAIICSCAELVRVRLLWSQLTCDPLPSLGQLDKLVVFVLGPRAYDGQKLHFRTGWFLNLKRLYLGGLKHLNSIEIEKGAMASLHELVMAGLPELKMVRHINFLTGLQTLSLSGMPEELVEKLSEYMTKKAAKE